MYSYKYFVYDTPGDRTSGALRITDLTVEIVPAYMECLIGFMFHNSRRCFRWECSSCSRWIYATIKRTI